MNNQRRKEIDKTIQEANELSYQIEQIISEETEAMEAMPENLQTSDRYYAMENAIMALETAQSSIDEAVSSLEEAKE